MRKDSLHKHHWSGDVQEGTEAALLQKLIVPEISVDIVSATITFNRRPGMPMHVDIVMELYDSGMGIPFSREELDNQFNKAAVV